MGRAADRDRVGELLLLQIHDLHLAGEAGGGPQFPPSARISMSSGPPGTSYFRLR